jgi:hypothetical protein
MSALGSDLTAAGTDSAAVATDQDAVAAAQASLAGLQTQLGADKTAAQTAVTQLVTDLAAAGYDVTLPAPPAAAPAA